MPSVSYIEVGTTFKIGDLYGITPHGLLTQMKDGCIGAKWIIQGEGGVS